MLFGLIIGLLTTGGMPTPLAEMITCYEELDYDCAEDKLTQALVLPLSETHLLLARRYDALLGVAWRSPHRVRRAVRAIYEIDPVYIPGDVPTELSQVFEKERPAPPPKPRLIFSLDYVHVALADADNDAAWWQDGAGLHADAGVRLLERYHLSVAVGAIQHLPQSDRPDLLGLTHYSADLRLGVGRSWGRLSCFGGLSLGAGYIIPSVDSFYERIDLESANAPFWVGRLGGWFDLSVDLWRGGGLGIRMSPELLIRSYKEQPHLSYLLPLMVGVRYGR